MSNKFISPGTSVTPHEQELLTILTEEGAEVAEIANEMIATVCRIQKRASKAGRFGLDEIQPGQPHDNAMRLAFEIGDMFEVVGRMISAGIISEEAIVQGCANKRRQLDKFMQTETLQSDG